MQHRDFLASSTLSVIGAASLFEDAPAGNAVASERVRVGIVGVA